MAKKQSTPILGKLGQWFPGLAVFAKCLGLVYSKRSMLRELGYIESVRERRPCAKDGSALPWMNYGIINFLEQRLHPGISMFEYGSGNSTQFYARRVKDISSLEQSKDWYEYNVANTPDNVTMLYANNLTGQAYAELIGESGRRFNLVIVDAADRVACVRAAVPHLEDDGVIVLDDSDDDHHRSAFELMKEQGFRRLDFVGLKPAGIRGYRSSVFYRAENCLGL